MKKYLSTLIIFIFGIFFLVSCDEKSNSTAPTDDDAKQTENNENKPKDDDSGKTTPQEDVYFEVVFNSNGGTNIDKQCIKPGGKANKPENPKRTGYTFDDWYYKGEKWSFIGYVVTENMTLEANWIINNYDLLLLNSNEIAGTITEGGNYDFDALVTIEATPNKGCEFVGWYSDNVLVSNNSKYSFNMPDKKVTLEAKWKIPEGFSDLLLRVDENNDYIVTGVKNLNIKNIVVPNLINEIANGAFSGCSSLESITLPFVGDKRHTSTDTYQYPFGYIFGTSSYTGGTLTQQYYYGSSTISTTSSYYYIPAILKEVKITDCEYIQYGAFRGCSLLTSITIANSVTSIGNYAFLGCSSLTNITIPNSVTRIGNSAFSGCSSLKCITIPNSVTSIGDSAFSVCWSLTNIEIPNSVTSIGDYVFSSCSKLTSITIPNSVTSIGNYAFNWCSSLTNITIPNSVTRIGNYAFSLCSSLTNITIPNSVTRIGEDAFKGCSSLESITLPFVGDKRHTSTDTYQYPFGYIFGTSSYTGGTETQQCYYGSSTTSTNYSNYYIPTTLKEVTIKDCEYIQYGSFSECSSLTSITIPNSVTNIGQYAFYKCSSLTNITIPNGVTSIGQGAFSECSSLTNVYYDGTIEDWCNITFVSGTSNPMYYATNFYILDETGTIKYNGKNYKLLTKLEIPLNVTLIGKCQFCGFNNLTNITIPNSVTSIESDAFIGCSSLTNIVVDSMNTVYDSRNNCNGIIETSKNKLISGCKNTTIPNSVTSIGERAFMNCSSLTSIEIPNSVTSIGERAFMNCSSLESIIIPNSVTSIGSGVFYGCSSLESIIIPNSVTSIDSYAFYECTSLSNITIPTSVAIIEDSAFSFCSSLTSITIPNSVIYIIGGAFSFCSSLTSIIIPNSVTSIGSYTFYECSSLTVVFYQGTQKEWNSIQIDSDLNTNLTSATRYYYSEEEPQTTGNYWHYVDGVVTIWN